MQNRDDIEGVLLDLLAQVQRGLAESDLDAIEAMIKDGRQRQAVETICRLAEAAKHPMPLAARAMAFKLADRLGIDPSELGLLN